MNDEKRQWQKVTLLESVMVAENVMQLRFRPEKWTPHKPGQHYDIRLTAPNGYQAERAYSLANPPEEEGVFEFGVQLLENGEVSPYLFQLKPGDQVEVRGPIGGHFVWDVSVPGPLYIIGGGSGMVPLMSMVRHHLRHKDTDKNREIIFLISARNEGRVLYKDELKKIGEENSNITIIETITDTQPPGFTGYTRRIDEAMIREVFGKDVSKMPMIYVCGPTPFVEVAASLLVKIGYNPHEIRTERFGG